VITKTANYALNLGVGQQMDGTGLGVALALPLAPHRHKTVRYLGLEMSVNTCASNGRTLRDRQYGLCQSQLHQLCQLDPYLSHHAVLFQIP
jgi:hypothetical protein